MRMSAAAVFAVLCLIGVAAITRDNGEGTIGERANQFLTLFSDKQSESDDAIQGNGETESDFDIHNSGTLMAENSLIDAIRQENQEATAVSGPAVSVQPAQPTESEESVPSEETPDVQPEQGTQDQDNQQEQLSQESQTPESQEVAEQENPDSQDVAVQGPAISEIESQQQSQPVSYVIQRGDTLIGISTRLYGNDSYVQAICELNGITNADNIQIGQKIILP